MPFNRPSPKDIYKRMIALFDVAFPTSDARVQNSVENVLSRGVGMASNEMHGHIQEESKEILPHTAVRTLERHASLRNIFLKQPQAAIGSADFAGADGTIIPAGTLMQRADNVEYTLEEDITITDETAVGTVVCNSLGAIGNAEAGVKLTLISPVAGVESSAVVAEGGISAGVDAEEAEDLRARVLEDWREPPQGGALHDYRRWAKEVAGVTRAWAFSKLYGVGTVGVTFVMDNKIGSILPDENEVALVQEYIDSVRPDGSHTIVYAPVAKLVDLEIQLRPNTVLVQQAILAEVQDFFSREAAPGETLHLSRLSEAISVGAGEHHHKLASPVASITATKAEMPILGEITWSSI